MTLEFPPGLDWFNTPPLSFEKELKGKIVVLDFWTFCCINCMHVLPELSQLEEKYANDPVVVVGVHSPKFTNEKDPKAVRDAVRRYEVKHPVVSDPQMILWNQLGVHSWPTLALIGPDGEILHAVSGEGRVGELDAIIATLLQYKKEALSTTPIPLALEQQTTSPLRYPGKVTATDHHLFIADSGHNQIVQTLHDGTLVQRIGSSIAGHVDGSFDKSCFYRPQGLCVVDQIVYVADAENNALRQIDLQERTVSTVARNLNTPWDVVGDVKRLYIAMAGNHQIWTYQDGQAQHYSGSGYEMLYDDMSRKKTAWAQPSGLALADELLLVADSESSAIRAIDLSTGASSTLAGGDPHNPRNLFAYGTTDGVGAAARFQHPLGVAWLPNQQTVIVADSYNHVLRTIDLKTRRTTTWVSGFNEPGGLSVSPDQKTIFVADTNNHRICQVEVATGKMTPLEII